MSLDIFSSNTLNGALVTVSENTNKVVISEIFSGKSQITVATVNLETLAYSIDD